jgi:hypothetical protein
MSSDFIDITNEDALERTIVALDGLKPEHAALVKHARSLAKSIDAGMNGEGADLKLHTEYRHILAELLVVGRAEELDVYEKLMRDIAAAAQHD